MEPNAVELSVIEPIAASSLLPHPAVGRKAAPDQLVHPVDQVDKRLQTKGVPAEARHDSGAGHRRGPDARQEDEASPISSARLAAILAAVSMAVGLIGVDSNVVATAIPSITTDFDSADDVGWYASAYLLTFSATQLSWGKAFRILPVKHVYLAGVAIFEIWALVAGVALNSSTVIVGRAISGLGAGGIMAGSFVIISLVVRLRWRPIANAVTNTMFAIAMVIEPLLGGVFTTDLTWRWCFFINLPFGGATLLLIAFAYNIANLPPDSAHGSTVRERLAAFDWLGLLLFAPSVVCLLLAFQWGGITYAWDDGRIVALLVLSGVGAVGFSVSQWRQGDRATIPPKLVRQKDMALMCANAFLISACFNILAYFLPIWFQTILQKSAVDSGIALLPFIVCFVASAMIASLAVSWQGQYVPFLLLGAAMLAVGAGLASSLDINSPERRWAGFIALAGLGAGAAYEQPQIGAQVVADEADAAAAVTTVTTFDSLGAALAVSAGGGLLDNRLLPLLTRALGRPFTGSDILRTGLTDLVASLPVAQRPAALAAFNAALRDVFDLATALAGLTFLLALGLRWRSVKQSAEVDEQPTTTGQSAEQRVDDTSGVA